MGEPGRVLSGVCAGGGSGGGGAGCWLVLLLDEVAGDDVVELDEEADDELLLDAGEVVDAVPDNAFASLAGVVESVCSTSLPTPL